MDTLQDLMDYLGTGHHPRHRGLLRVCAKIERMYRCPPSELTIGGLVWARPDITIHLICGRRTTEETNRAFAEANRFFAAVNKIKRQIYIDQPRQLTPKALRGRS